MTAKTIFILGAGFSAAAGVPTQSALLGKVLEGGGNQELIDFIEGVFGLNPEDAKHLALEDVYTAIHKAVSRNRVIKGYGAESLKSLEDQLTRSISEAINVYIEHDLDEAGYLGGFIRLLQLGAQRRAHSVISLNWDILLDQRIGRGERERDRVYVDYGTQCTGIGNEDNRVKPALLAKSHNEPVVQLLKLHGSLNWLVCPQCERLYVNWDRKVALEDHQCRKCESGSVQLQPSIILPTFQKTLDSLHYRNIWNQAANRLASASKVVFIGYSFPLADFDFRALITRHLSTNAEVEVVLHAQDSCNGTGDRYSDYFGRSRCEISYDGVENYVDSLTLREGCTE
jgi:hypothetical protein